VVICTLNAAKHVETKFEDILHQDYPLTHLDVIVVDGGSHDGTVEILNRIRHESSSGLNITILENTSLKGKSSQINEGLRAVRGDVVITTDVDVRMPKTAVRNLVGSLSAEHVGGVTARQVLTNPHQSMVTETETVYRDFYEVLRIGESNLHSTPIFHGGLCGFRREAISPIYEDVNLDDMQLALSAIRKGFRAVYEPSIVFYTESPKGLRDSMRQRVRRGQGLQRVFWRNRDMLSRRKYGAFGVPIFLAEFYFHLISPFLFWIGATSLAILWVLSALPFLAVGLVTSLGLAIFLYWRRTWFPVRFIIGLTLYMTALIMAMLLHLLGHNYARWSRKSD
jgi:cellulose synthase/poly-beta-1,6-N-acetylglucosamine synthase-like glycosyltransferase